MLAVDAMGGDYAPDVVVEGAYYAALQGVAVTLFGKVELITNLLSSLDPEWKRLPLSITDCHEVVHMHDKPTKALVHKKDASLFCAIRAVADGQAEAVVSAGNSGAMLIGAVTYLKRVSGLLRPALATFLPTISGSVLVLDLGANADCKPEYLHHFALMGTIFVRHHHGVERPRVALLSNGHEPGKGSLLVQQTYDLLLCDPRLHFVGNIESRDILQGSVDVVVCDGFVGNILLKAVQGTAQTMMHWIKQSYQRTWYTKCLGVLSQPLFTSLKERIDYKSHAGALLLGVRYPCVVAHGCASARSIEQTIRYAHLVAQQGIIQRLDEALMSTLTAVDTETSVPLAEPSHEENLPEYL